jgi:hypothetical protein
MSFNVWKGRECNEQRDVSVGKLSNDILENTSTIPLHVRPTPQQTIIRIVTYRYKIVWRPGHTWYIPRAHKDDCRCVSRNKGDERRQNRCIPEFDKASRCSHQVLRRRVRWMLQTELPLSPRVRPSHSLEGNIVPVPLVR